MKIYETINSARLVTDVTIEGRCRVLSFEGGAVSPWRAGLFQTDDEILQRAIEESPSYGKSFRLRMCVETPSVVKEQVLKNIAHVTNKQMAIEWVRIHLGIVYSLATNPEVIRQSAVEKGYSFLNWTKR